MGSLSDEDRERVLAKARADAVEDGLPADIEDRTFRQRIGALLIRVKGPRGESRRPGRGESGE
jgi:hypothetical protein